MIEKRLTVQASPALEPPEFSGTLAGDAMRSRCDQVGNRQLALSAPPEAIWNGWRKIGQGVPSAYGRLLAEGKFEDIVGQTQQL